MLLGLTRKDTFIMRQFDVIFFNRDLLYQHHDSVSDPEIKDDYLAIQNNTIEIAATDKVKVGHFISLQSDDYSFFGVVTDVKPDDYQLKVSYKSFLSVFDEDALFDTDLQKKNTTDPSGGSKINSRSLEATLKYIIDTNYVNNPDALQNLRISVTATNNIKRWGLNLTSDTEGMHHCIVGLYRVLIVNAMKLYGVALNITPDFSDRIININISTSQRVLDIDGDLNDVDVRTLTVDDRPNGVNKLTVYNTSGYTQYLNFYVHPDKTWSAENTNRITPVVRDVKGAYPDSSIADPTEAFVESALDIAYGILSGLTWNNLIELEVSPNDELINPLTLDFGQTIRLHYNDSVYESILTGIELTSKSVFMTFGSERINFTKRRGR